MNNKIIVTNFTALKAKYGAGGVTKINTALKSLIAADKARGLQTKVIALDSAAAMKAVNDATDPEKNKAAIDAIFGAQRPDYLVLLGSTDVIPHQDLRNPVFGGDDVDQFAYGDIPYACEAPYSQKAKDFIGPTRVVGRLPDLTGATDPAYLIGLLGTAAGWKSRAASDYANYFAISADVWKKSTALSLQKVFGSKSDLQLAPPKGPTWTNSQLARRAHFINCHGAEDDPTFYGQKGKKNFPPSHLAAKIDGKIAEGTVASIECCYGAQLYDAGGGQIGICSTYLAGKAYGYFGSSTIAYGPEDSNGSADLICQYFLRRILAGASLGRAVLEARLEFAGGAAELDPVDIKTLAQFNLLGDPSIQPVSAPVPHVAVGKSRGTSEAESADAAVSRTDRRRQLLMRGLRIGATQPVASRVTQPKFTGGILKTLNQMAAQMNIYAPEFLSYKIEAPSASAGLKGYAPETRELTKLQAPSAFHVVMGQAPVSAAPAKQIIALVAKEVGGKITSYRELHSR